MNNKIFALTVALLLTGCEPAPELNIPETIAEKLESTETTTEEYTWYTTAEEKKNVYVYVCGAVVNPGVYELPAGSRAFEAIDAAGGVAEDAAAYLVNLAETLYDEEKLYIPYVGETISVEEKTPMGSTEKTGKVNINTASKEQLMSLSGIGESKANAIIQYREEYGSFAVIEDIMQVNGIKEAAFAKIKDSITVE